MIFKIFKISCLPAFILTLLSCSYCPGRVMFWFKEVLQQVIYLFDIVYRIHIPLELASMVDM